MKKLLLIDGNSMLFRAYYATMYGSLMQTNAGIPTNAIYGFALMLKKAIETIEPDRLLVAFDAGKDNFRREIYEDYKGTRSEVDEALKMQFPLIREYLTSLHITYYEKAGIEADDIIGSIAKNNNDYYINILTSDKDMLQLIDDKDNITVFLMQKGITEMAKMDEAAVYERYTLKPLQIIDLKGLSGDPSDNIPGVRKIGDKTAIKLLTSYQSVEGVYEHIEEIKGKMKENLLLDKDLAFMSKKLATIITDAQIDVDLDKCGYLLNSEDVYNFYSKYEMRSLAKQVDLSQTPKQETVVEKVEYKDVKVTTVTGFKKGQLGSEAALFMDENGIGVVSDGKGYYLDKANLMDEQFVSWLASDSTKVVYDIKQWHHLLLENNLTIGGKIIDEMIIAFLCDGKVKNITDLLAKYHLTTEVKEDQLDLFALDNVNRHVVSVANKLAYLKEDLINELNAKQMVNLYENIELPLSLVLAKMEMVGVRVNVEVLDKIAVETQEKLKILEENIYRYAGHSFNINSPKQLAEIIYDELKLARSNKKRSTDIEVLNSLKGTNPIIDDLIEYRKYSKLYSTYAHGLKKYIKPDGKIHTVFNQCVAETGRLSSSDPNLQNISVRNEESQMIREAFIPEPGCKLVGADYSQVELRMLAHLANEPTLIAAFRSGIDIHTKTAMDIFGVAEEEVTPLQRRMAKTINFGIVYGMSEYGLKDRLDISVFEARNFISQYYAMYPRIKTYMDEIVEGCLSDGYVTTVLNRRRDIPEIKSSNHNLKEFGKRAAMNAPVQGSAADLMKIAMINVDKRIENEGLKAKMILQIHDEMILNVPESEVETVMKIVEEEMANAMKLSVPLIAQATSGDNWLEVK